VLVNSQVALALYTVRNEFFADAAATLAAVRQIGYGAVEFAGLGPWKAGDLRAQLDELGLLGLSAHVPLQRMRQELPEVMREAETLGLRYLVFPWLAPEQRNADFYRGLVPTLRAVGEACRQQGMVLCYHNHDFEFEPTFGRQNALQYLANELSPQDLAFEIDVYWAAFAGYDPLAVLEDFSGRVPLVHLKDMSRDESRSFAEVGAGRLDFPAILEKSGEAGAEWAIVEQDHCQRPPLESARLSFQYLSSLGLGA
jgi:sugar phosphate isomerase/epimerase